MSRISPASALLLPGYVAGENRDMDCSPDEMTWNPGFSRMWGLDLLDYVAGVSPAFVKYPRHPRCCCRATVLRGALLGYVVGVMVYPDCSPDGMTWNPGFSRMWGLDLLDYVAGVSPAFVKYPRHPRCCCRATVLGNVVGIRCRGCCMDCSPDGMTWNPGFSSHVGIGFIGLCCRCFPGVCQISPASALLLPGYGVEGRCWDTLQGVWRTRIVARMEYYGIRGPTPAGMINYLHFHASSLASALLLPGYIVWSHCWGTLQALWCIRIVARMKYHGIRGFPRMWGLDLLDYVAGVSPTFVTNIPGIRVAAAGLRCWETLLGYVAGVVVYPDCSPDAITWNPGFPCMWGLDLLDYVAGVSPTFVKYPRHPLRFCRATLLGDVAGVRCCDFG
ncbi:hypothetical protein [Celerinatantimonas sp. YJH-8]|uniref:hypothetical protein n=1 Tax=Celerinatantimonas sp. YJH-8 TaxID=3228714 RepID=UPI0038C7E2D2